MRRGGAGRDGPGRGSTQGNVVRPRCFRDLVCIAIGCPRSPAHGITRSPAPRLHLLLPTPFQKLSNLAGLSPGGVEQGGEVSEGGSAGLHRFPIGPIVHE